MIAKYAFYKDVTHLVGKELVRVMVGKYDVSAQLAHTSFQLKVHEEHAVNR